MCCWSTPPRSPERGSGTGLEAAINDRPWPGRERKLDGRQEAHLIAFACSAAPEGHTHHSVVGRQVVELELLRASPWRRCARYNELKPWKKKERYPQGERGVLARMEDVLDLEYNPERGIVSTRPPGN